MKSHDRKRPVAAAGQEKSVRTTAPTGLMGVQASSGNQVVLEMMRRGHEEEGQRRGEAVQRSVDAATTVQRAGPTEQEGAEAAGPAQEKDPKGKEIIARLSQSIEQHTTQTNSKANIFAPGTWWPEQWMIEGPSRLRKTLERRVMRGQAFSDEELDDIRELSSVNAKWLKDVGIGTYEEAKTYAKGPFDNWLKLDPGKRVLTATLAIGNRPDIVSDLSVRAPTDPAYTLGRFMLTQTTGTDPKKRKNLEAERNQQIRDTAVDTLHPEGIAPERMHDGSVPAEGTPVDKDGKKAPDYVEKDAQGREMLTKILLILRHGLQLYDPKQSKHVKDHEQDVIRALSHGGRVNVRIPALSAKGDPAYWLPHFLGATQDATKGETAEHVSERGFATHRTDIGTNKGKKEPKFKERGGVAASLTNKLAVGAARPKLWGQDISGGGLGSKDWNGAMVLPNGSYGHVLLVYHRPTMEKDGSLQIGVETIAPHAESPVGYEHDFRSTEATSNPESILHGHKGDKIGSGGLSTNERYVDLRDMAKDSSGGWQSYLEDIKQQWDRDLAATDGNAEERRALYEELVGKRLPS
ncbi:PE-PGRS family protein [Streptomyces sp. ITFR-6]|uniref:PE-PGRS family protein n=1 Tax=Streptomyces sp. ITFR-6 TaxID=3075197 RepID=UPI002889211A|nr:PE-PGRS family protein [Streptomyces sp. ITFR-6]WNI30192.1 PE-PGRS family protein [Streptomyces sp. ITFR-6]